MKSEIKKNSIESFPKLPGVYQMFDDHGNYLYIGKAKNLRQRLTSYFSEEGDGRYQIKFLMKKVHQIETIVTKNEKEALLLENTLIKKYQPRYNIFLRDDKTYLSLKLNVDHDFPSLTITRNIRKDGGVYFGPYTEGFKAREVAEFIEEYFKLRTCSDHDFNNRSRPCLQYQIKRCEAPCVGYVTKGQYQSTVQQVILFLQNRHRELIKEIKSKMNDASKEERYEEALRWRNLLQALDVTLEKQHVIKHFSSDEDALGWAREGDKINLVLLIYRGGLLAGTKSFSFKTPVEDSSILENFILQYYSEAEKIPKNVLLPFSVQGLKLFSEILTDRRGEKTHVIVPERGENIAKIALANSNAKEKLLRALKNKEDNETTLLKMQEMFHLNRLPQRIECYDISNIQGKHPVGSCVCFVEGQPDKKSYRKFKIKTVQQANDFAMMHEILSRRLSRTDWPFPDLIVIDGGKGQLNSAHAAFKDLEILNIDLISLAKEKEISGKFKPERVFLLGRKDAIELKPNTSEYSLLVRIRDEAHRFGVTFHRQLRGKSSLTSKLDAIEGLGPAKKKLLLNSLGSIQKISEATLQTLSELKGFGPSLGEKIYRSFHS